MHFLLPFLLLIQYKQAIAPPKTNEKIGTHKKYLPSLSIIHFILYPIVLLESIIKIFINQNIIIVMMFQINFSLFLFTQLKLKIVQSGLLALYQCYLFFNFSFRHILCHPSQAQNSKGLKLIFDDFYIFQMEWYCSRPYISFSNLHQSSIFYKTTAHDK